MPVTNKFRREQAGYKNLGQARQIIDCIGLRFDRLGVDHSEAESSFENDFSFFRNEIYRRRKVAGVDTLS